MGAIAIDDFEQHCTNYHQSRDADFEAEYEVYYILLFLVVIFTCSSQSLAVGPLAPHEVSQMFCNKQKNRFANIYPCEGSLCYICRSFQYLSPQTMSLGLCWKRFLTF